MFYYPEARAKKRIVSSKSGSQGGIKRAFRGGKKGIRRVTLERERREQNI